MNCVLVIALLCVAVHTAGQEFRYCEIPSCTGNGLRYVVCLPDCEDDQYCDPPGLCKCNHSEDVIIDGKCKNPSHEHCNYKCKRDQDCLYNGTDGVCACKNDSLIIEESICMLPKYVGFSSKCFLKEKERVAFKCKIGEGLLCEQGVCICDSKKYREFNSTECLPKKLYLEANNISIYRAKVNDYCATQLDCIEGLVCDDTYKCRCPSLCHYKEVDTCDCGEVTFATSKAVVFSGIILGLVSFVVWGVLIDRLLRRHSENIQNNALQSVPSSEPNPPVLPVSPSDVTPSAPLASIVEMDSLEDEKPPQYEPPPSYASLSNPAKIIKT